jgi:prephenate dehydratase
MGGLLGEMGPARPYPTWADARSGAMASSRRFARARGAAAYATSVAVAYFGPPGTFTEEALRSQPDLAALERVPQRSVPEVIAAVERGEFEFGVVPIENMIEGSVSVTLDTLAFESDLLIQREVDLSVSLNLCAPPGVTIAEVRSVESFPHAVAQCRAFLASKLPEVEVRPALSTADAARAVARSKRRDQAAICNRLAAELYGLEVLVSDIEDHPENQTRFVVVGRGVPQPTGHDKTSIVCFQRQDRPGSLLAILQEFAARAINLSKLESRPTKRSLGDYCFFIDCEGHIADELLADALRNLVAKQADIKFLGSYAVGGTEETSVAKRHAAGRAWKQATAWVEQLRAQIRPDSEA